MKYVHCRVWNDPTEQTAYLTTLSPKGGLTLACKLENQKIKVGIAVCSEKDAYCKRTGRDKALERFLNNKTITIDLDYFDIDEILEAIQAQNNNKIFLDILTKNTIKKLKKFVTSL